ncbi:unnamed protein product [Rangifer tarandus platyrhynchus]|uniref:Uncharacterized protein n=1 Tax=Rangifer tarandus platyrhynchus TaxID=3082113 RepID=A0ABN8YZC8_RANTA|nr:unnamed protein product [Rangifer tarandus platyrhynchus]
MRQGVPRYHHFLAFLWFCYQPKPENIPSDVPFPCKLFGSVLVKSVPFPLRTLSECDWHPDPCAYPQASHLLGFVLKGDALLSDDDKQRCGLLTPLRLSPVTGTRAVCRIPRGGTTSRSAAALDRPARFRAGVGPAAAALAPETQLGWL